MIITTNNTTTRANVVFRERKMWRCVVVVGCSLSLELGKMLIRWNSKLKFFIAWCYVYDGFCDWHIVASVGNFATGG